MRTIVIRGKTPALTRAVFLILQSEKAHDPQLSDWEITLTDASTVDADLLLTETEVKGHPALSIGEKTLLFPFLREELLAALRGILHPNTQKSSLLSGRRFWLEGVGALSFTPKEWELFLLLYNAEDAISREALENALWQGKEGRLGLNVYIHKIRKKLEKDGVRRLFSLRGGGYRLLLSPGKERTPC